MRKFLAGFIIGLIAVPLFAFLYVRLGYFPVSTAAPPFPFERKLAGMALHARTSREASLQPAVEANAENLMAGAKLYRQHCAVCHGTTTEPKTMFGGGMFPRPPALVHGKGVTDDPVGETYWVVSNGIRLTGMPAFDSSLNDTQRWQLSQLLAHAHELPPDVSSVVAQPPPQ